MQKKSGKPQCIEHDERKVMIMSSFFKKLCAGAVIGLAFGILAAFGFIGVTKVMKMIFPAKTEASAKIEADIDKSAGAEDEGTGRSPEGNGSRDCLCCGCEGTAPDGSCHCLSSRQKARTYATDPTRN